MVSLDCTSTTDDSKLLLSSFLNVDKFPEEVSRRQLIEVLSPIISHHFQNKS